MAVYTTDPDAAQARMQAWHSRRPTDVDWALLNSTVGVDEYLARARQPPFAHWLQQLGTAPSLHEVDRVLRTVFRQDCRQMARWFAEPWRTPLSRLAALIDLPLLTHLERRESLPLALLGDEVWQRIALAPAAARFALATGLNGDDRHDVFERWLLAWRASLPPEVGAWNGAIAQLRAVIRRWRLERGTVARDRPERAAPSQDSVTRTLALLFRRSAGTPLAMVCELALIALDLQRLRAGLTRRWLTQRAATVAA